MKTKLRKHRDYAGEIETANCETLVRALAYAKKASEQRREIELFIYVRCASGDKFLSHSGFAIRTRELTARGWEKGLMARVREGKEDLTQNGKMVREREIETALWCKEQGLALP